jgi:hypothetical protein
MTEETKTKQKQARARVLSHLAEQVLLEAEEDPAMRFMGALDLICRLTRETLGPEVAKEIVAVIKRAGLPVPEGNA